MLSQTKLMSAISNHFLELIVFPTEQCNFRCVYCYEDFSIGKMQPNIVKALKTLIASRISELSVLKISWFGGEPLAAKDVVVDLHEYIINLKRNYPNLTVIFRHDHQRVYFKRDHIREIDFAWHF